MANNDDLFAPYSEFRVASAEDAAVRALREFSSPKPKSAGEPEAKTPPPVAPLATDSGLAKAAALDIGRGILETPRNIVGGVRDAFQAGVVDPRNSLAAWLEEKIPLGTIGVGEDGKLSLKPTSGKESYPDIPDVRKPDSTTGGIVRGITQFLVGFLGPGKGVFGGIKTASGLGAAAKAAGQGAVADFTAFNENEARLSDLIQQFPALQNPISEYLASDQADGYIEGRFKNAVEGLGIGVVADGLLLGLKAMRNAKIASSAASQAGADVQIPLRPSLREDAFAALGDESAPVVATRTPQAMIAASDGVVAAADPAAIARQSEPETYINFARIDTPEDVQVAMQQMADTFKTDVDSARRGTMSFKQIELNAEQENAFQLLAERRQGQPLNAEQSVAARQLWASSGEKLVQVAELAAENPSATNLFAFRKMLATHYAIQNEVIAARTETARALASWRIPTGSGIERFAEIETALRNNGNSDLAQEMAKRVAALGRAGMTQELETIVGGSTWARSRDAFLEVWVNGLLSGPKTHLVNMLSNTSVMFQQMVERETAARIGQALGYDGGVALGEASAQLSGMVGGLKDALRYSYKSFLTNKTGYGVGKVELARSGAISSESWNLAKDSMLGRTVDALGSMATIPGRMLGAEDEFFKTLGYRMELNALAVRRANQELSDGRIQPDEFKSRVADIVAEPPPEIRLDAIDQATYQTFTSAPGDITKAITKLVDSMPLAGRILLPFVRTPSNILKYTFERTPLAPLMSHVRADLNAGGARREIAMARIATGSALLAVGADMALTKQTTGKGPSDPAERQALTRTGWQPYSVKVGDRYYAYNRLDPIGTTLGLAADMMDILTNDDMVKDEASSVEAERALAAIAISIGNNVMSRSYLTGMSELVTAMSDPKRYGEAYFQGLSGSVIPTGVAEVTRQMDPYMREANTIVERMRSRIPGLSESLPHRRDLWGQKISYQSGLGAIYDAASPIYSRRANPSPIDEELLRLDAFIPMPGKETSFDGISINLQNYPGAYSRYVELAGNELKDRAFGLGAKDYLDALVQRRIPTSHAYYMLPDGKEDGKIDMIRDAVAKYRSLARAQMLEEFPDIAREVERKKQSLRSLREEALNGGMRVPSIN